MICKQLNGKCQIKALVALLFILWATASCTDINANTSPLKSEPIRPDNLRCEYLVNPLGIDVVNPRLSWVLESDQRGEKQTAYRVLVSSSNKKLEKSFTSSRK